VAFAELLRIHRTDLGVIALATFADVVVQARQVDQLGLGQAAHELAGQGEFLRYRRVLQLAQVLDEVEGVRIDRVDVEQVVLHLPDDQAEFRQVAAKDAVAVHPPQVAVDTDFALEQLDEQAGIADIVAEGVVDQVPMFAQQAHGIGTHALDLRMLSHQHEDLHHGERGAPEHVRPDRFDVTVMQAEARVQRLGGAAAIIGEDDFFEVLDDQVAQLADAHHHPVVLLHELFDGALGVVVAVAEQCSDAALVVEQQAVLGATGEHVQGIAHFPQEVLGRGQQFVLAFQQEAFAGQGMQVQRAVLAAGDPEHRLDVAQATGRALDVGLEVVLGVVVLVVAGLEFGTLGQEEILARPHVAGAGHLEHALAQVFGAGDGPAFHQVGDYRQVGAGLLGAFVDGTHALADLQTDVPEQGEEALDGLPVLFMLGGAEQDQQVDVRVRVQLAAAIAADRHQRDTARVAPVELVPGLLQDVVHEPGAGFDQRADFAARTKAFVEHLAGLADDFLEGGDGARLEGQFRLELATVEQLGIHLGHRVAFLSLGCLGYQAEVRGMVSSLRRVNIS